MSRLSPYFIVLLCALPHILFGQNAIRGVVFDVDSENRISDVEVTNLRTNQLSLSNGLGIFTLSATVGDTLRIVKTGFNERNFIINSSTDDIIIRLKSITELRTVNVYGTSKEKEMQDALRDYRKQGSYYNGEPPALAYIFSPISALHERFGKTGKRAKRFREYISYEQEELLIDRKFNRTLVSSLTGLKDKDLTNFLLIYRPSVEQAERWNDYDVTEYIKRAFQQFEQNGRPPAPTLPKLVIPELSRDK